MMKRFMDVVISGVLMCAFMPLMVMISLAVWLNMGCPVLFSQIRPGLHGKPFQMFKFRTMNLEKAIGGRVLPDADRLTALGRFLRSTSLDELPELWNVFKGEMSLVGPRPLLMEYLPLYSVEQARRHDVRPGLTGWAQVNGRNAIGWEEKFALDLWYVDNQSFVLDMKILWLTLVAVFRRDGVSAAGHDTMPKFKGSHDTWSDG